MSGLVGINSQTGPVPHQTVGVHLVRGIVPRVQIEALDSLLAAVGLQARELAGRLLHVVEQEHAEADQIRILELEVGRLVLGFVALVESEALFLLLHERELLEAFQKGKI